MTTSKGLEPAADLLRQLVGVSDLVHVVQVQLRVLGSLLVVKAVLLPALVPHDIHGPVDLVREHPHVRHHHGPDTWSNGDTSANRAKERCS